MVLKADRTLYVMTKAGKRIQKIIVPKDMASAMVTYAINKISKIIQELITCAWSKEGKSEVQAVTR